ncbi:Gfo/Idh/MocA family oxidoreductase [Maribellus sp. CM-23]|uniref:Gfo/Idh/MocA family protein n=1 Tax=Maribellus sp. CM-23 TaxID=2781026 RepID=UPI001F2EFAF7|nr:Gfo/Idh/MocA family oxidoreductase [Maribellus sp. CM-23]MCE4563799.1 Gfo/Idh/MocA family oxidoreductase [Maribellus sp. CM-23]
MSDNNFSRRRFLTGAAVVGAAGAMGVGTFSSCASGGGDTSAAGVSYDWEPREYNFPPMLDEVPAGTELKAGIIGCGGRGTGAAINFLEAGGSTVTVTALGDVLKDRLDSCRDKIKNEKGLEVPAENCFVGFDAFEKVIDSGVDIVILATPPKFRPEHFAAAVKARKHVFMEKPIAVDTAGVRQVLAAAKMADNMGLKVVTGTQRRHQHKYQSIYKELANNSIGRLVSGEVSWNGGQLWYRDNNPNWSEMEWMIRDWVNWCWLSGDHIVEQHVHNIDVANWFFGKHPVKALGFGSRQRRPTGDQYDNFAVDFIFDDDRHVLSTCRQINGCSNAVNELFHGTKGHSFTSQGGTAKITDLQGNELFAFEDHDTSPYVQEHKNLITCIRQNTPFNEAEETANSVMTAIMGRVSAYTGKQVTWDEMMNSDMKLGPDTYIMGDIGFIKNASVPVPGSAD